MVLDEAVRLNPYDPKLPREIDHGGACLRRVPLTPCVPPEDVTSRDTHPSVGMKPGRTDDGVPTCDEVCADTLPLPALEREGQERASVLERSMAWPVHETCRLRIRRE